jgi:hypothetical protein
LDGLANLVVDLGGAEHIRQPLSRVIAFTYWKMRHGNLRLLG